MPLTFETTAELIGVQIPVPIEVNGGSLYISDSIVGVITVNDGEVIIGDSTCGDITIESSIGNSIRGGNFSCGDLTLNGDGGFQQVHINGLFMGGAIISTGVFTRWSIKGAILGQSNSNGPTNTLTDLTNFSLEAASYRTGQHGWQFTDCVVGDATLQVLNPGAQTDNTYDGIQLLGACDRLNFYGSVRGAVNTTNNNRYGFNAASTTVDADVWMVFSGHQTAATNDPSGNVVFH